MTRRSAVEQQSCNLKPLSPLSLIHRAVIQASQKYTPDASPVLVLNETLIHAGVSSNGHPVESFPAGLEKAKEEAAEACLAVQSEDAPASVLQKCIDLSVEAAALSDRTVTSEQSF